MVAYVMTVTDLGWEDALHTVRAGRSCANPNLGFQRQLQEFEEHHVHQVTMVKGLAVAAAAPGRGPVFLCTPRTVPAGGGPGAAWSGTLHAHCFHRRPHSPGSPAAAERPSPSVASVPLPWVRLALMCSGPNLEEAITSLP